VHTHTLTFDGPLLVKRYASWARGEHRREWSVLQHVHRHRPDLAPTPVSADLDAVPPTVTMTVVPGTPLTEHPSPIQLDALTTAITTLWTVPLPDQPWRDDLHLARRLVDGPRPADGVAAAAHDAAGAWWRGSDPARLRTPPADPVLGHRDPNLANYLWDGRRIRIVDFEDAGVSDPANEVALLVEHLSTRGLDAGALAARFDVDPVRLRAARRLWAAFWLWLMLPGGPSPRPPEIVDDQARRLLWLMEEPESSGSDAG
jgi:Ser/Thr protein kinase RdoA (MazF antagonist)